MDSAWNLAAFLAVVAAPALAVGVYFVFARPPRTCQEFIFGKYSVHWMGVGVSLAGLCLAPLILLWPAESIRTGSTWTLGVAAGLLAAAVTASAVHVPVLQYDRSIGVDRYVQDRFGNSRLLRRAVFGFNAALGLAFCVGSLLFCAFLAADVWRPHAPLWTLTLILAAAAGGVALTGGHKAAVALSASVLSLELLVALISALIADVYRRCFRIAAVIDHHRSSMINRSLDDDVGLASALASASAAADRGFAASLVPDYGLSSAGELLYRQNVWVTASASFVYFLYVFGCHQTAYQHYCSLQTTRRARYALAACVLVFCVLWFGLCTLTFLAHRTAFERGPTFRLLTDPFGLWRQLFRASWGEADGAAGFFFGCLTSAGVYGSLPCTLVSLASSAYDNLVKPYVCLTDEWRQVAALKLLTALYAAVAALAAALLTFWLGQEVVWPLANNIWLTLVLLTAPFAGLYVLALWTPCTTARGAAVGLFGGLALALATAGIHLSQFPVYSSYHSQSLLAQRCLFDQSSGQLNASDVDVGATLANRSLYKLVESAAEMTNGDLPSSPLDVCRSFDSLRRQNEADEGATFRLALPQQSLLVFVATVLLGLLTSLVTGKQDIYALDWNLVHRTCIRFASSDCCRRQVDMSGSQLTANDGRMGKNGKKKRRFLGPYTTSESFRYSKQGPFPDTSYHNPKVQDYMATLKSKQAQQQ